MCQNHLQKTKNNEFYNNRNECNLLTVAFQMWAFHWDSFEDTIQQNAETHQSILGNSKWVCHSELCDRVHSLHSCWNRVVYVRLQEIQIKLSMIHLQQLQQAALQMLLHDWTTYPNTFKEIWGGTKVIWHSKLDMWTPVSYNFCTILYSFII
jgi:hypothetical protein